MPDNSVIRMQAKFAAEAEALPPVSLPQYLKYEAAINPELSNGAGAAKAVMADLLKKAEGVNARRTMIDNTITKGANILAVERIVAAYEADASKALAKAQASLAVSTKEAKAKLNAAVDVKPTSNAVELRAVLRGMPKSERDVVVRVAFANNDEELIAAIQCGHVLTHGCEKDLVDTLSETRKERIAPLEYKSVAEHNKYLSILNAAEAHVMRFTANAYSGTKAEAEKQKAAAAILATYGMTLSGEPANV